MDPKTVQGGRRLWPAKEGQAEQAQGAERARIPTRRSSASAGKAARRAGRVLKTRPKVGWGPHNVFQHSCTLLQPRKYFQTFFLRRKCSISRVEYYTSAIQPEEVSLAQTKFEYYCNTISALLLLLRLHVLLLHSLL